MAVAVDAVVAPYPTLDAAGVSVLVLAADVVLDVVLYPSPDAAGVSVLALAVDVVLDVVLYPNPDAAGVSVVLVVFYLSARASEMP